MTFSSYCRRAVNGSYSLFFSRISSSHMRSKHSISRAQNVSSERPLRKFVFGKDKSAGRNSKGRITIFHSGGGAKWSQRIIDLKRNTSSIGVVERIEYDPNHTSRIAVVRWVEGAAVDRPKKVNTQENFTPPPKTLPSITTKGEVNKSKPKVREIEKKLEIWSGSCTCVSYILATHQMEGTHQMEAGKMGMNYDLTKRSNDELIHRY